MCVIITLPLGSVPPFEPIRNAVLNNPHGFGFISIDRGKLEAYKEVDLEKGNDPEKIYKAILDTRGVTRYLHVRNNTVGLTSYDNCHPFTVYAEGGRRVEFMHNGTIHQYKPTGTSPISDTQNYATNWLSPLLQHFTGVNGLADYSDPFFRKLVGDHIFGNMNRGLLVANDLEPLYLGTWVDLKLGDDVYRVSNDDYFNAVRDHRVHDGRKESKAVIVHSNGNQFRPPSTKSPSAPFDAAAMDAAEAEGSVDFTRGPNTTGKITQLKEVKLNKVPSKILTSEDLESVYGWGGSNIEDLDDESMSYMVYVTVKEWIEFATKKPQTTGMLLDEVITRFHKLFERHTELLENLEEIVQKHDRASKTIAELKQTIAELEKSKKEVKVG